MTSPEQALPLTVLHGQVIRLGDQTPEFSEDLSEPVFLHAPQEEVTRVVERGSFFDDGRNDGLPVKEAVPMALETQEFASTEVVEALEQAQGEEFVRVWAFDEGFVPRLEPVVTSGGRLSLMQVPQFAASLQETSEQVAEVETDSPIRRLSGDVLFSDLEVPAVTTSPESDSFADIAAPSVSLAEVATEKKLLESAWIDYDGGMKKWQATWSKPPLFHYGMVLLPELAKRVESGQKINFVYKGMPAELTKREDGQLFVSHAGEARLVTAGRLKRLLEEKIETDGMILFLDDSGNLVLQANGDQAFAMNEAVSQY